MKVVERNVVRLAVVQHLRAVYGIKIKNWNKNRNKQTSTNTVKVFGLALEGLPHCHVLDYGDVPCFIVDVCTSLMDHLDTEGLFRKSGSVVRVKSLRARLEQGEDCLHSALPLDVAVLVKQFFRELPDPLLTVDLHAAFLKAQELPTEEERTSATVLLSCVLPDRSLNTLRYFCSFLRSVSQRCAENKMDSSNLSVIFAPNLFHCGDGGEKMSSGTEKRLKQQATAIQCLIDNAHHLGVVPQFLMEKVPAMLGCDAGLFSPSSVSLEDSNAHSDLKKNNRRSLGDVVNGALNRFKTSRTPTRTPQSDGAVFSIATPIIMTPNSKRKLPVDSAHSYGFSNKKRRSIKKNLGLELFPSALFGGTSTPGSAHSAAGALDAHSALPSSVGRNTRLSCSSARRKSRRLRDRSVSRVESGKSGCFSPRVAKKEPVRKSLRLRFSLGKSSRESNVITHSQLGPQGSEVIGWRLATQESTPGFHFTKEFSLPVLTKSPSKGSRFVTISEDNPSTEQSDPTELRRSWRADTPDEGLSFSQTPMSLSSSEPAIATIVPSTGHTLLKIRQTFSESEKSENCDQTQEEFVADSQTISSDLTLERSLKSVSDSSPFLTDDPNVTFGQIEITPLSPLHIDSALFDSEPMRFAETSLNGSLCLEDKAKHFLKESGIVSGECSQLIDALDIQSPVAFRPDVSGRVQSTPYAKQSTISVQTIVNTSQSEFRESEEQHICPETRRMKVSDQIRRFNMMNLNSPKATVVRSPLKFQRTPVQQSIRRINSMMGKRKDTRMGWCASTQVKAVSLESGLCSSLKPKPPVPPKKAAALEDVTNTAQKIKTEMISADKDAKKQHKSVLLRVSENDSGHYRGSPRNPLMEGRLMSAMKPIDL